MTWQADTDAPRSSGLVASFITVATIAVFAIFAWYAPADARPTYWVMSVSIAVAVALIGMLYWSRSWLRRLSPSITTAFVFAADAAVTTYAIILIITSLVFGLIMTSPKYDDVYGWFLIFETVGVLGILVAVVVGSRPNN